MNESVEVSIVLPAYNEAKRLEASVERTAVALNKITSSFEIIIAEDGSNDGTDRISEYLTKKYDFVVHIHSDKRLGRGCALNRAFKISKGEILGYIDVDLATDMQHLEELIKFVRGGYDFVTGSRMLPDSNVKRPFKRGFASKGFNFLTRLVLGSKLYDHQCGFKSFKRSSFFEILDEIEDTHWFWDTELFIIAQREGYKVKEFPVNWRHGGETKVNFTKDVLGMAKQIFRLWYNTKFENNK